MPPVQTDFRTDYDVGYPGMVANGETSNRISRTIEDADGIGFGRAAFDGAGDHGCTKTPSANLLGITMTDKGVVLLPGAVADTFPEKANVPIFQRGTIWVRAGAAFDKRDGVAVLNAAPHNFVPEGTAASTPLAGWSADHAAANAAMVRITNNRQPGAAA